MKKEKVKFVSRSAAFMVIFLILTGMVLLLPVYIYTKSGESMMLDQVIALQNNAEPTLYGRGYSDQRALYKLKMVNSRECDVVALGSSRVMQFRSHFFYDNTTFCNAGGGIYNIFDFEKFLKKINSSHMPKTLILGFDQNFFNPNWYNLLENPNYDKEDSYLAYFQQNLLNIYIDYFEGKINLTMLTEKNNSEKIGITAIMRGEGFRNDGSYFSSQVIANNQSIEIRSNFSLESIKMKNGNFYEGHEISNKSINSLKYLLDYCKENHIDVVGFIPPYAKIVLEELEKERDDYAYVFKLNQNLTPIFREYGYELYDFTELDTIGSENCEVIDGFHGSEKAYLRILIKMLQTNDSILEKYSDKEYLIQKLNNSPGCFLTAET